MICLWAYFHSLSTCSCLLCSHSRCRCCNQCCRKGFGQNSVTLQCVTGVVGTLQHSSLCISHPSFVACSAGVGRCCKEVEILSSLSHPNIVQVRADAHALWQLLVCCEWTVCVQVCTCMPCAFCLVYLLAFLQLHCVDAHNMSKSELECTSLLASTIVFVRSSLARSAVAVQLTSEPVAHLPRVLLIACYCWWYTSMV